MTPERRRLLRHRHLSGGLEPEIRKCMICERTILDHELQIHDGDPYCMACAAEVWPLCDYCQRETHHEELVTVGVYKVCAACAERDDEPCEQPRVTDRED